MKKILLTNNSKFIDLLSGEYDKIYTDYPYLVECYGDAIFLDTLLDNDFEETIRYIRNQGYEINKEIINLFFPKYKKRNIDILNIKIDFTNIFTNIIKLFKLIELHSKDEITIAITNDELYNINSPDVFEGITNRFSNFYYWIADFIKIKNVNLVCKKY